MLLDLLSSCSVGFNYFICSGNFVFLEYEENCFSLIRQINVFKTDYHNVVEMVENYE